MPAALAVKLSPATWPQDVTVRTYDNADSYRTVSGRFGVIRLPDGTGFRIYDASTRRGKPALVATLDAARAHIGDVLTGR